MTDSNPTATRVPTRWTRLNITLHWLIALLVGVQFFIGEWMAALFDSGVEGKAVDPAIAAAGYLHMAIGISILLAALLRLWDRFAHARPAPSQKEPNWTIALARVSHAALYLWLVAMPVAGLTAWLLGSEWLAQLHAIAGTVLLGIIALHVAGALANHFWFKTDALRNMMPGRGRPTRGH